MAQAARDGNYVPTMMVASNADGVTPIRVKVNPSTHAIENSDGTTGSDQGDRRAARDQNYVPVFMGVSSADGVTPIPIYGDPATGQILTKSS